MASDPQRVQAVFLEAAAVPPADRAAVLDRHCGGAADLRQRVEALLRAHDQPDSFLEAPAMPLVATIDEPAVTERPGTVIGPYKLLEQIGEGGFGLVFMAEQQQPIRRKVAVKVLKPGMDSRQVIARFEAERQALALMDHPNIAKVHEAGETASGRPYFVMELVKGIPITAYCDQNGLPIRERLELFLHVCQAVQHAHQKGTIHRDIKPTNVLVTLHDGTPVPKIIDFGIAKALGQQLTDKTLFTNFAQLIGTPLYMSPEQAALSGLDVDTRSDIYSLGVLLYELLTGTPPFDKERLSKAGYDEMRRIIREEEPPKPSTCISTLGQAATAVATQRKSDPKKLSQLIRGELDWIVMKCLEKDRNRRYDTASALAADVQRYLHDEPVLACPPSTWYRFRKLARRNKRSMLAASLVVLALVGGSIGTTIGLICAEKARHGEAEQRRIVEAVLKFVEQKIFGAARPEGVEGGLGRKVSLRQAVEAGLPSVKEAFTEQPLIEARLRMTWGTSFLYLGDAQIAAEQFEAARTLYTKHLGPHHPDTLESMHRLALGYNNLRRHEEALRLQQETLELRKDKLGPEHSDTLASMDQLGLIYWSFDWHWHADAIKLNEDTLALRKDRFGMHDADTVRSMANLALLYDFSGRYAEAIKLLEEVLAIRRAEPGPDHPDTLETMHDLAKAYGHHGRVTEAAELFNEELALRQAKVGGRYADVVALHEEMLRIKTAKFGLDNPQTFRCMTDLSIAYAQVDRYVDAIKLQERTLALKKDKLGPNHHFTLWSMNLLARFLVTAPDWKQGDLPRALELAKQAAESLPREFNSWGTYGTVLYRTGDWKGAIEALEKAISLRKPDDPTNAPEGFFLAMAHWQLAKTGGRSQRSGASEELDADARSCHRAEARKWYDKSVQWMEKGQQKRFRTQMEMFTTSPGNRELKRFRAEAAELLGIKE